jgi:hypothetical protein
MNENDERLKLLDAHFEKEVYGYDKTKEEKNITELEQKVRASIKSSKTFSATGNSPDIIDFFDALHFSDKRQPGERNHRSKTKGFLENVESGEINLFFGDEANRFQIYRTIDSICAMIPEIGRAISLYCDMIMSPNTFSGSEFNFDITNTGEDQSAIESGQERLKSIDTKYKVSDEHSRKCLADLVKYGDSFSVVLEFKREINTLLSDYDMKASESATSLAKQKEPSLAAEDVSILNGFDAEAFKSFNEKEHKTATPPAPLGASEWEKEIDSFLNLSSHNSISGLLEDDLEIFRELKDNDEFATESGSSATDINLSGSILRHLEPSKVIKVEVGGTVIGYYYLDVVFNSATANSMDTNPYACPACDLTYTSNRVYSFMNHANNKGMSMDNRLQTLTDIFAKRIATKLNRKYIAKNAQFRDFIYTMLKANHTVNKTSIIFLRPGDVIHMKRGSYAYGESVLAPVLYFAKLYVLTILAALMQQVINGKDKTVYYIDTGLDEDSEGAVNAFIADLKMREISLDDFNDITGIFNRVTKSNALYIPVVDGKKAVEFDTFPGQEAQLNNDFIEFLKKSTINGTGIPASFLDTMSDVEFATTLIMQNGNVQKTVIGFQKIANAGFTELFRKLLKNEKDKDNKEDDFLFTVKYPEPTILDNRKTEEEFGRVQGIADFIIQTMFGDEASEENEASRGILKQEIIKKLMPQINWVDYQSLLLQCLNITKELKLQKERSDAMNTPPAEPNTEGETAGAASPDSWA